MKLTNTDGMAFIGPGSESFWTALQFVALAVTFVAISRQLRAQRLQMRENTKGLRSQAHDNALSFSQRAWVMLIEDEGLARVLNVGCAEPGALDPDEWIRVGCFIFMQVNGWECLYYQHRDGTIPDELWVGGDAYYGDLVATRPGLTRFRSVDLPGAVGQDSASRGGGRRQGVRRLW